MVLVPALEGDAPRQGDPLASVPTMEQSFLLESPAGGEAGLEGSTESVGWPVGGVKQG